MLPTAVPGCTPLCKFLLSNRCPTPTLSALGFGILTLQVLTLLGESRQPLGTPAEACGPPHSPTSKDVWEAGRESSQQQAGWTGERRAGGLSDTFGQWIRQVTESWQYWLQGEGISQRLGDSWQFQLFREETGNRLQQTGENLPNSGQLEAVSWGPASEAC